MDKNNAFMDWLEKELSDSKDALKESGDYNYPIIQQRYMTLLKCIHKAREVFEC